jgi:hypothetical protein
MLNWYKAPLEVPNGMLRNYAEEDLITRQTDDAIK